MVLKELLLLSRVSAALEKLLLLGGVNAGVIGTISEW